MNLPATQFLALFLKGLAMGAANVIPGVSGGTIALVTGIYERLINAIKSCDLTAIKLVLQRRFADAWTHVDGTFLAAVMAGVILSIISLARLLEFLLMRYERLTMAFFFGLILISILLVGKTVQRWNVVSVLMLIIGTVLAVGIALLVPLAENASFGYVFLCGVVAICSMILPGLSGSFILIVMGNYALILGAISRFDMQILMPLALGCAFGMVAFAHLLAWIFKHFRDATLALMTGFVIGSLAIIWPWKQALMQTITRAGKPPKEVVTGYEWFLPDAAQSSTWLAFGLIVLGGFSVWLMDRVANRNDASRASTDGTPAISG